MKARVRKDSLRDRGEEAALRGTTIKGKLVTRKGT